jgi:hypothetical protein
MVEGPRLHITAFPTLMVRPLDESQGSSPLQGHSSWLMCEVALNVRLKPQLDTQNFIDRTIKVENTEIGENEPIWPKKHNVI